MNQQERWNGVIGDLHVHSEHSHDSQCRIADIRTCAEKKGIRVVCITDHCDIEFCDEVDIERTVRESIADAKRQNQGDAVEIFAGVEIGEAIWNRKKAKKILALEGLDQVIGSVHAVRYREWTQPYSRIDFSLFSKAELRLYLEAYFDDVWEMVTTTDLDILAHLTCPLRYINGKYGRGIDCRLYENKIRAILQETIARGIALEVNTSCCDSSYDTWMPEEWIITVYQEMGGKLITCASDSHVAERVGYRFDKLYEMLKRHGFRQVCYFKNRRLCKLKIGDEQ